MKITFLGILFVANLSIADHKTALIPSDEIKVLQLASQTLEREEKWNRKDNRICPVTAITFSLYCALKYATLQIYGKFDHRLPVIEEVRKTIEIVSQKYHQHRLMDYNNDSKTTFTDIKNILRITESRLSSGF